MKLALALLVWFGSIATGTALLIARTSALPF